MAVTILKNVEVWLADSTSVLTAGRVKSCAVSYEAESIDTTAFTTSTGVKSKTFIPGMLSWSADLEIFQDFGASGVDALVFPLVGAETPSRFRVAISSTGADAEHPQYSGVCRVMSYNPLSGGVGN